MPFDLRSLKKLDFSAAPAPAVGEQVVVLVKMCKGAPRPSYVLVRANISSELFSAEVPLDVLKQLEADPAVESIALSRPSPTIS